MYYINQLDYPDIKYLTRTSLEGEAGEKGKHTTVESLPSIYSGENENQHHPSNGWFGLGL